MSGNTCSACGGSNLRGPVSDYWGTIFEDCGEEVQSGGIGETIGSMISPILARELSPQITGANGHSQSGVECRNFLNAVDQLYSQCKSAIDWASVNDYCMEILDI